MSLHDYLAEKRGYSENPEFLEAANILLSQTWCSHAKNLSVADLWDDKSVDHTGEGESRVAEGSYDKFICSSFRSTTFVLSRLSLLSFLSLLSILSPSSLLSPLSPCCQQLFSTALTILCLFTSILSQKKKGYGALFQKYSENLNIKFHEEVQEIQWNLIGASVRTENYFYKCKQLIITLPLGIWRESDRRGKEGWERREQRGKRKEEWRREQKRIKLEGSRRQDRNGVGEEKGA
jgi:hypothetical protein